MNDGTLLYSSVLSLCWREGRRAEEEGDSREKERREEGEEGEREKREMVGRNGKNKHVVVSLAFHTACKQKQLAKCV